jgi:hypothetical protein
MSFMAVQMARQGGMSGPIDDGLDKASTTRPSSSANFYVDSLDKDPTGQSGQFVINKKQSLFNGFFNRIAVAEVLMDWGIPNIAAWWGNNTISVVNGGTATTIGPVTLEDGFYTAIQALQSVAVKINQAATTAGDPLRLTVSFDGYDVVMSSTGVGNDPFYIPWLPFPPTNDPPYALARQLFTSAQLAGAAVQDTKIVCSSPRILGTTYIDIVSPQLTYNQELKDSTTDSVSRDVLYRWYFANDNVPQERETFLTVAAAAAPAPALQYLAPTNLPVLQGYNPFVSRRALPVPKQIRWDPKQPIGQVSFEIYDDRGRIVNTANFPWNLATGYGGANFQFQMSLLLSEN